MKSESSFQQDFIKFIKSKNCKWIKLGIDGQPDYLVIPDHAPMFFVELKKHSSKGHKWTENQQMFYASVKNRGHEYVLLCHDGGWVWTLTELLEEAI